MNPKLQLLLVRTFYFNAASRSISMQLGGPQLAAIHWRSGRVSYIEKAGTLFSEFRSTGHKKFRIFMIKKKKNTENFFSDISPRARLPSLISGNLAKGANTYFPIFAVGRAKMRLWAKSHVSTTGFSRDSALGFEKASTYPNAFLSVHLFQFVVRVSAAAHEIRKVKCCDQCRLIADSILKPRHLLPRVRYRS